MAHRGDSFHAPENTLLAAELALKAGADAWELDVQCTRDGVPVVIHDPTLARTTDAATRFRGDPRARHAFRVAEFDLDEVRSLDAGAWFLDEPFAPRSAARFGSLGRLAPGVVGRIRSGTVRVPTLREALEFTARHSWLVNVEVKADAEGGDGARALAAVLAEVRRAGLVESVLLSSFDHGLLPRARAAEPRLAIGVLTDRPVSGSVGGAVRRAGGDCFHPSVEAFEAWRSAGAGPGVPEAGHPSPPALVYTVNDARPGGLAARLAAAGAAGLFTDDPAGMRRLFPAHAELGVKGVGVSPF